MRKARLQKIDDNRVSLGRYNKFQQKVLIKKCLKVKKSFCLNVLTRVATFPLILTVLFEQIYNALTFFRIYAGLTCY
jgi:hypothetical protein